MEKVEGKSGEVGGEKEENLGEKLRREVVVGRRVGPFTPVSSWRLWAPQDTITGSARKLGAALWEFQHYLPLSQMNGGFSNGVSGGADLWLRRRRRHPSRKEKGLDLSQFPGHAHARASSVSADQPETAGNRQNQVATSLIQHRRSNERIKQKINNTLQPDSPPSCGSSMEVAPYDPAVIPTSPLHVKGRIGESQYGLKTSTELLKVLNRIWSLEEQHISNVSLIKSLKTELDHARVNIKDLLQQRNTEHGEIDDLIKQFSEEKLVMKNKEQNRREAAIKSVKDELDGERKLRKRSESLHRKLARDLSKTKVSLSNALEDLEMEKKSRILLEHLCDEFARGIKDYEQEMHALKQNPDKSCPGRTDHDRLILHISESWLDERMQMQNDGWSGRTEKRSIVEKLYFEIESFLRDKQVDSDKRERRSSLESIPFNAEDKEDSIDSDSNCFELDKPNRNETMKSKDSKGQLRSRERTKSRTPSSLQVKFEEQMAWAMSHTGNRKLLNPEGELEEKKLGETAITHDSEPREGADDGGHGLVSADGGNMHPHDNYGEASCSSKGWREVKTPEEDVAGSSSKVAPGLKENTLKAKLLEARSRGHRSRLKVVFN